MPELSALAQAVRAFDGRAGRVRGYRRGRIAPAATVAPSPSLAETVPAQAVVPGLLGKPPRFLTQARHGIPEERQRRDRTTSDFAPVESTELAEDAGFWAAMAGAMSHGLWATLQPHLAGIEQLTAIPHGGLHLLPLAAGAPAGLTVGRYPGLAFFAQRRGLYGQPPAPAAAAERAVGLIGFAGEQGDIPLAEAETTALAGLYRDHGTLVYNPSHYPREAEPAGLLHIACHGGDDPNNPERVALCIAPQAGETTDTRHVLNQDAIVASPTPPLDLYFSACLGGQTVEGLSGTPSGVVSACFRRIARWVVGSLVSIPDQWAMLLALLTHQALVRDRLLLPAALAEGKRRLAEGNWYPDTGERLQAALRGPLLRLAAAGVQHAWELLWGYGDPAERLRQFSEQAIPALLQGWPLRVTRFASCTNSSATTAPRPWPSRWPRPSPHSGPTARASRPNRPWAP